MSDYNDEDDDDDCDRVPRDLRMTDSFGGTTIAPSLPLLASFRATVEGRHRSLTLASDSNAL